MKEGDTIQKVDENQSEINIKLISVKNPISISKRISKVIIQMGDGNKTPIFEDNVVISLEGKIINNNEETVFDKLRTLEFKIGEECVPSPIEKVARSMKKGEISLVKFDKSLQSTIYPSEELQFPDDADIVYKFELLRIDAAKSPWDCKGFSEHYNEALLRREEGSKYFRENKLTLSATKYKKALLFLECYESEKSNSDELKTINKLRSTLESNLAAVALLKQEYETALSHCNNAIECDQENLKAYYRRGQYYLEKKMWPEAEQDFLRILEVEPNNISARNALLKAKKGIQSDLQKEKLVYKKMAQKLKSQPALYSDRIDSSSSKKSYVKVMVVTIVISILLVFILLAYFML